MFAPKALTMIRTALSSLLRARINVVLAATLTLAALSPAAADQNLPASALGVRHTLIALSAADAAMPLATAYATTRETAALLPAPSLALKPETADAMAAVRVASARRATVAAEPYYYERRAYRAYREPFVLMLGIGY